MKWVIGVLVVGVLVTAAVVAMMPEPVRVDAATASVAPMRVTVDEEGQTRIRERYVVSSPLTGRLRRIALDPGDMVRAGETALAVIEPTDPDLLDARALAEAEGRVRAAESAVRQAGAALDRAGAEYDLAEKELGRVADASENGAATDLELDRATTAERRAMEALRGARFGREIAEHELDVARSALLFATGGAGEERRERMPLFSPIDGRVLRVFQESVAVVDPGEPLIEVGDPRDLEIVIDVLSTDAVNIERGQAIVIEHWGRPDALDAVVRLVEPSAFTKVSALGIDEQRVNVIADFATPPEARASLGDGFRIEASVIVWSHDATLQVPASAAFRDGDRWAAYVIEAGRAQLRAIELGRQNGRSVQVLGGLNEGERVILHPSDELADGVRVEER